MKLWINLKNCLKLKEVKIMMDENKLKVLFAKQIGHDIVCVCDRCLEFKMALKD